MVKTWVAVNLVECSKNIVIPMKYIYTMHRWLAYNRSINSNNKYLIFYSNDFGKEPNFHATKCEIFDESIDATYHARLLKCFGAKEDADNYIKKRRSIAPVVYNSKRLKETPKPRLTPVLTREAFLNVPTMSQQDATETAGQDAIEDIPNMGPFNLDMDDDIVVPTWSNATNNSNDDNIPVMDSANFDMDLDSGSTFASTSTQNGTIAEQTRSNVVESSHTPSNHLTNVSALQMGSSTSIFQFNSFISFPNEMFNIASETRTHSDPWQLLQNFSQSSREIVNLRTNPSIELAQFNLSNAPRTSTETNSNTQLISSRNPLNDITNISTMRQLMQSSSVVNGIDYFSSNNPSNAQAILLSSCDENSSSIKDETDESTMNEEDDVVLVTPLDDAIIHKPNETKYDTLTGTIPFKMKPNGDRVFSTRNCSYTLTKSTVNHLKSFNTNSAFRENENYDRTFVNSLLVSFVNVHKLKVFEIEKPALNLIEELYAIRVKENQDRLNKLNGYIEDKCTQLAQKYGN